MSMLSYIIWNGDPVLFSFEMPILDYNITVRWYGVLFALGFLISQQIMYYIYKREGKPVKDIDTLTIYMVIATIIGARLGHVIFYQPELLWENPLGVLLPIKFDPNLKFVGLQGLASHGGAIGILVAIWFFCRKKKPGQNYLQVVDRIVIVVALTGAFIRVGNYFNSEIIGKPTHSDYGVVFAQNTTKVLSYHDEVENVSYVPLPDSAANENGYQPVEMIVDYKSDSSTYLPNLKNIVMGIVRYSTARENFDALEDLPTRIVKNELGGYSSLTLMYMIPRYPTQLYEAFSCILLFILLFWLWHKKRDKLPDGSLFAIFLIICFGLRFIYEFFKENQVSFENNLPANMGQILSIPLLLAGVVLLIYVNTRKKIEDENLNN